MKPSIKELTALARERFGSPAFVYVKRAGIENKPCGVEVFVPDVPGGTIEVSAGPESRRMLRSLLLLEQLLASPSVLQTRGLLFLERDKVRNTGTMRPEHRDKYEEVVADLNLLIQLLGGEP